MSNRDNAPQVVIPKLVFLAILHARLARTAKEQAGG